MSTIQKKNWQYSITVIFTLAFLAASNNVFAINAADFPIPTQINDLEEQISTDVTPNIPKPGDEVTITLSAFGTDLNLADISWSVDGSIIKSGKGQKSITVTAGKAGKAMIVVAKIAPQYGYTITKTFTINPATVDLIWEAHTYTPPFYRGKALYSPQENVVFVGMPNLTNTNGVVTNPGSMTYIWRQDTQVVGDRSGYGVNAFAYKGQILSLPVLVDLVVSDKTSSLNAENFMRLSPTKAEMGLYEDSPIYGVLFNSELSGIFDFGSKEERVLTAYPYFFGGSGKTDPALAYTWTINSARIAVPSSQYQMTLRNSNSLTGISIVGATITNTNNILELASAQSTINFKKPGKVFPH